jgi:D-arabinose 1-dehydrogenase-like Zn-dependent alcohol dehydrogenase
MKAALLDSDGSIQIREARRPEPGDQAIVKVRAAGVCGTELHFQDGMLRPDAYPFILGHESSGVIEQLPPGETSFRVGDRVSIYNLLACGRCRQCRLGRDEICDSSGGQIGFNLDGGFAEYVRAPLANLVPLPDAVSFEDGALLACSGMSAVHGVRAANVGLGSTAVVNGVGGVGLMVIQVATLAGANVIAVGDSADKLQLARQAGAVEVIHVTTADDYATLGTQVRKVVGQGADYFFELVGTKATMKAGFDALGKAGTFISIGYTGENLEVNPVMLIINEQRLVSCVAAAKRDLETAVELAATRRLRSNIQSRLPLEKVNEALASLRARKVLGRNVLVMD